MAAGATYRKIQSQTLGSSQTSITFTSIPQTYTDLNISLIAGHNTRAGGFVIYFNSDTGTTYTSSYLLGTGSSRTGSCSNDTNGIFNFGDLGSATIVNLIEINVNRYTETNAHKSTSSIFSSKERGRILFNFGLWRSNSAITSITLSFTNGTDTFATGTVATLYGIEAA
jgi:hypothetical protein